MPYDAEDVLDLWENTGFLGNVPDPINLALLLQTQCQTNKKSDTGYDTFKRCVIPALINVVRNKPDLFAGLIDTADCTNVYRLGEMPKGTDEEISKEMSRRILEITTSGRFYFGGIVAKNGKLYLLTDATLP